MDTRQISNTKIDMRDLRIPETFMIGNESTDSCSIQRVVGGEDHDGT